MQQIFKFWLLTASDTIHALLSLFPAGLQGLGALIVRVDAAEILKKLFWGGGAVSLATSSADFHVLKCRPADKLEDGTVNFLDIVSLKVGRSQHT
jgi:selenocysteine lyase/cysteine desulfurase